MREATMGCPRWQLLEGRVSIILLPLSKPDGLKAPSRAAKTSRVRCHLRLRHRRRRTKINEID